MSQEKPEQIIYSFVGWFGVFVERNCVGAFPTRSLATAYLNGTGLRNICEIKEFGKPDSVKFGGLGDPDETLSSLSCARCEEVG